MNILRLMRDNIFILFLFFSLNISQIRCSLEKLNDEQRFEYALQDTQTPTPYVINKNLIEVIPTNRTIIWNTNKTKILVTSLRDRWTYKFLPKNINNDRSIHINLNEDDITTIQDEANGLTPIGEVNEKLTTPYRNYDVDWVTVAPKLLNFGYAWKNNNQKKTTLDLLKRINERLGLPPEHNAKNKIIVELWVKPEDVLRPSADPEIFDSNAVPDNIPGGSSFYKKISHLIASNMLEDTQLSEKQQHMYNQQTPWNTTKGHRYETWFKKQQKINSMPWTQLGYTYDYSSEAFRNDNLSRNFGESEFIIKPGSKVEIAGVYSIDKYFSKKMYQLKTSILKKSAEQDIEIFKKIIEDKTTYTATKIGALEAIKSITEQFNTIYKNNQLTTNIKTKIIENKIAQEIIDRVSQKNQAQKIIDNLIAILLSRSNTISLNDLKKSTTLKKLKILINNFNQKYKNYKIEEWNNPNLKKLNSILK